MSHKNEVGGRKTWPNKSKLAQSEHRGLVDTSAKVGNIWFTGGDGKRVMTAGDRGVSGRRS